MPVRVHFHSQFQLYLSAVHVCFWICDGILLGGVAMIFVSFATSCNLLSFRMKKIPVLLLSD